MLLLVFQDSPLQSVLKKRLHLKVIFLHPLEIPIFRALAEIILPVTVRVEVKWIYNSKVPTPQFVLLSESPNFTKKEDLLLRFSIVPSQVEGSVRWFLANSGLYYFLEISTLGSAIDTWLWGDNVAIRRDDPLQSAELHRHFLFGESFRSPSWGGIWKNSWSGSSLTSTWIRKLWYLHHYRGCSQTSAATKLNPFRIVKSLLLNLKLTKLLLFAFHQN